MLAHFLQFPQGGMNMCYENFEQTPIKSLADFWTPKNEQVYLFNFVSLFEKSTKYNLGGNKMFLVFSLE